jgi:hypothetical protein
VRVVAAYIVGMMTSPARLKLKVAPAPGLPVAQTWPP